MIDQNTIDRVIALPLEKVISKFSEIKKKGKDYSGHCPFHEEKTPSFTVSPAKNIYKCFGCGKGGNNPVSFVMDLKGFKYPEAIRFLANEFNIEIIENSAPLSDEEKEIRKLREELNIINNYAANHWHSNLNQLLDDVIGQLKTDRKKWEKQIESNCELPGEAWTTEQVNKHKLGHYMFSRIGSFKMLKEFKIGYAPEDFTDLITTSKKAGFDLPQLEKAGLAIVDGKKQYNRFMHRLMFPIQTVTGSIAGFTGRYLNNDKKYAKYINSKETALFVKSKLLYGIFQASGAVKEKNKAYLVEGNTDLIKLHKLGIKNVVATCGTALTEEHIEALKQYTLNICLLFDGDDAGQGAISKYGELLSNKKWNVTAMALPDGEDPDTFFQSKGQFNEYCSENEKDWVIHHFVKPKLLAAGDSIATINETVISACKFLLQKSEEQRKIYISKLAEETSVNRTHWKESIKTASIRLREEKLNKQKGDDEKVRIKCDQSQENRKKHKFYSIKQDAKGMATGIAIKKREFLRLLKDFGFFRFDIDRETSIYVRVHEGKIHKVNATSINDTFIRYVKALEPYEHTYHDKDGYEFQYVVTSDEIHEKVLNQLNLFDDKMLNQLVPDNPIEILNDPKDKKYFFFRNKYIIVDKDGFKAFDYTELKEGFVWADCVLQRDFAPVPDNEPGYFERFFENICNKDPLRKKQLMAAVGYLMHNFMERKRYEIILTDSRISEEDENKGRSGKSLLCQAITYMLNANEGATTAVEIPGKEILKENKHKYQNVSIDTTLVSFDDIYKGFEVEHHYNIVTGAIEVHKMYKDPIRIKAKIVLSTNRPIILNGDSDRDRVRVFEIADYYHAGFGPDNEFGHWFFRDWEGKRLDEWHKFNDFMIRCCKLFFKSCGEVSEPKSINLHRRELFELSQKLTRSSEFVHWMDYLVCGDAENNPYFQIGEKYTLKELFDKLKTERTEYNTDKFRQTSFTKLVKFYLDKENVNYDYSRPGGVSTIIIKDGLKSKRIPVKLIEQYWKGYEDQLNNIEDKDQLKNFTDEFNRMHTLNVSPEEFKKAVKTFYQIDAA